MTQVNAEFSARVVIDTRTVPWQPSPSRTVSRKRLDLVGGVETGRVTSVVRYDRGSSFPAHDHPEGEEVLVLEGVFSDEFGDYPQGTYLLNPPGFAHAPFSREGCVIFVKLRQYGGQGRRKITVDTTAAAFSPLDAGLVARGVERLSLYCDPSFPEAVWLYRLSPGAFLPAAARPGGEEVFVLSGAFEDGDGAYSEGTWLRLPQGHATAKQSRGGALLYLKEGHLAVQN